MLENFQGDSWGSIPPLRMPSLLPHDLCHGQNSSRWLPAVIEFQLSYSRSWKMMLWKVLHSICNMQYALNMQYAGSRQVAISFSNALKWKVKVKLLSRVRPSATPWTAAFQALLSMGFARQEYWSGVPLPSPPITSTFYLLSLSQMSEKKSLLPTIEEEPMQHISLRVKVRLNNLPWKTLVDKVSSKYYKGRG